MNPYDAAHNLARALRESSEFKEMKEAQSAVKTDPSAKEMLLDFRKEQFNMHKQQLSGVEVSQEQKDKLEKLYEVINMNTLLKRLLTAEYKVSVLLEDIQKIINEANKEIYDQELIGNIEEYFSGQEQEYEQ